MKGEELALRRGIIEACREMNASDINQGTSGNISVRYGDALLITPSGVSYGEMSPRDIARMPIEGKYGAWTGPMKPSSEWRFHLDIIRARPEVGAVVHAHSTYATALAISGREIPAMHYMIAAAGGPSVRLAPYATYGTKELSDNALKALEGRTCCLLANHGMIATGPTLKRAFTHGDPVRCVLVPDSCYLDITLPKALGGGSQRLSLVGGFTLLPLVTLRRTEGGRRGRR